MKERIKKRRVFSAISERDIDLLLLAEIYSSSRFRQWLVSFVYSKKIQITKFAGVFHRPEYGYLGAVDVLFLFVDQGNNTNAILIENKLDEPRQDLQTERYFEIGEKGIADGLWASYTTCLFSPTKYYSKLHQSQYFSSYFSYEDFAKWFSSNKDQTVNYKIKILTQAISQANVAFDNRKTVLKKKLPDGYKIFPGGALNIPEGYQVAKIEVNQFWQEYWQFCKDNYSFLEMGEPGQKSRVDIQWAVFKPKNFEDNASIIHKMPQGFMDLSITLVDKEQIEKKYDSFIDDEMIILKNNKNLIIRINVPAIADPNRFEMIKDIIAFSLQKAVKLYRLYNAVNNI